MEFLSLRQKQRAWSGSHTVNAKANHSGYTPQNWWAHYKGCALCSLASHQSLNQQAEKENWVWYALSSRRREGLWRFNVADLPSQPSSISNSWLPSFVMGSHGRHGENTVAQKCLAYRAVHHPCRSTLAQFPNLSSAPSTKKIASSQFGANHTFNILACYWGMHYHQFTDTRHSGSSFQEVGTVRKLSFSL